jgi:hypothetical protein
LEAYARQAKDTEMLKHATEIRLRAERRAGELLADMPKHQGGRPEKTATDHGAVFNTEIARPMTLAEMGVTDNQSSKWQKLASLPVTRVGAN